MEKMNNYCKTCVYFEPFDETEAPVSWKKGECRRYPPSHTGYIVVGHMDWCGEYVERCVDCGGPVEKESDLVLCKKCYNDEKKDIRRK